MIRENFIGFNVPLEGRHKVGRWNRNLQNEVKKSPFVPPNFVAFNVSLPKITHDNNLCYEINFWPPN